MTKACAESEQIIVYDSDSDHHSGESNTPHCRTVAKRAEIILVQQKSFRSVGEREAGRRELMKLGGAYGEFCCGAPLSVWVADAACMQSRTKRRRGELPVASAPRTPGKKKSILGDEIIVPHSGAGGVCGYCSPLPKTNKSPSVVSSVTLSSPCKGSRLCSQETIESECSTRLTSIEADPLTPDSSAGTSLLSQAERSAVEILAHDIDNVARECWRATHEELSPSAIYAEDDKLTAAATAQSTRFNDSAAKRKRLHGQFNITAARDMTDGDRDRCFQFETEKCLRPSRVSVSGMVLQQLNERTQQRLTLQSLMLPY